MSALNDRAGGPPPFAGRRALRPIVLGGSLALAGCAEIRNLQSALDPESTAARLIANLWWAMFAIGAIILAAVVILLATGILRARGDRPARGLTEAQGWTLVVIGGVVAPVVAILALVTSGVYVESRAVSHPPEDAITIAVEGRRWWWEVAYLDDAGRRIATTANEIHIPVSRPVRFLLGSDNVIHSFWVPALQGKTDLIPGQPNESWLRAERVGVYRGQCAEFCGVQHALMAFLVIADPPDRFDAWLQEQARPAPDIADPVLVRGREVFLAAGCGACHTVRGTPANGQLGPDLTHLGSRRTLAAATIPNTRGHLGGWIADPQHVKPGNLMPPVTVPPQDLQALLSYLESLT